MAKLLFALLWKENIKKWYSIERKRNKILLFHKNCKVKVTKNIEQFNIILAGVGGQGIITLTRILAEAALISGKDIKTSELHGLSQREGSVETHVRFGKEIYSPLVQKAGADLTCTYTSVKSYYATKIASQNFP